MKIILTEKQYQNITNSINELDRKGFEDEYVDDFESLKDKMVKLISKSLYSWGETEEGKIVLFNKDKKILFRYSPITKELYYDRSIGDKYTKALPPLVWIRNGKFFIYEVFKKYFPYLEVKHVMQAFIV